MVRTRSNWKREIWNRNKTTPDWCYKIEKKSHTSYKVKNERKTGLSWSILYKLTQYSVILYLPQKSQCVWYRGSIYSKFLKKYVSGTTDCLNATSVDVS